MFDAYDNLTARLRVAGDYLWPLALRLILAWEFWESGITKLRGSNWFADIPWADWQKGFPWPFSYTARGPELAGRNLGRTGVRRDAPARPVHPICGSITDRHHRGRHRGRALAGGMEFAGRAVGWVPDYRQRRGQLQAAAAVPGRCCCRWFFTVAAKSVSTTCC